MAGNRRAEQLSEDERRIEQRLARLLAGAPRRAPAPTVAMVEDGTHRHGRYDWHDEDDGDDDVEGPASAGDEASAAVPGRDRPDRAAPSAPGSSRPELRPAGVGGRRFERSHAVVVTVIVLAGLLLAGWAVLRARPVAIASSPGAGSSAAESSRSAGRDPTAAESTAGAERPGPADGRPAGPSAGGRPSPSSRPASAMTRIKVHVLGAVRRPGVVELAAGSRVQDALSAAGGPKPSARLGDLNLAQPLGDGQQVFIARDRNRSEVRDPAAAVTGPSAAAAPDAGAGASGGGPAEPPAPVNLNTATPEQLDQLPGIGPVTAQKILDWRQRNGRFSSVEELQEVDGIGPKTFADLQPLVSV